MLTFDSSKDSSNTPKDIFMTNLETFYAKKSSCLKPRILANSWERHFSTLTRLFENHHCGKHAIPYLATECCLIVNKKMVAVDLVLMGHPRKDLICDWEKANNPVVDACCSVSLF